MSHKGIRLLIENVSRSLADDIEFAYGRRSDVNAIRDKQYPFISLDPPSAASTFSDNDTFNYSKTWSVQMAFYGLDDAASSGDEYKEILDKCDVLVDKFITKLNFTSQDDIGIVITNINQTVFIKALADCLTGYILSFNVQVPDNWDYCRDC